MPDENDIVTVTEEEAKKAEAKTSGKGKKNAAPAAEGAAPAPEKPKAPKPVFYVTSNGAGAATIYGQLQKLIFDMPGKTDDELVAEALKVVVAPKVTVDEAYIRGYLTGGLRPTRNFFTHDSALAATELPVKAAVERAAKTPKESGAGTTAAGAALVKAMEEILEAAGAERTQPISAGTLSEKLGKPLNQVMRPLQKLEKDGFLVLVTESTTDDKGVEKKSISTVALTEKKEAAPTETVEAPAAEPVADLS